MLPLPFRQEPWVLQSASADQPNPPPHSPIQPEAKAAHQLLSSGLSPAEALRKSPTNLVLARILQQQAPEQLQQPIPRWWHQPSRLRPAFLLPGELRCLERSGRCSRPCNSVAISSSAPPVPTPRRQHPYGPRSWRCWSRIQAWSQLKPICRRVPCGSGTNWRCVANWCAIRKRDEAGSTPTS